MQAVGGNSDSRPSRFGDRSYKLSVHNCAKLTGAKYRSLNDSFALLSNDASWVRNGRKLQIWQFYSALSEIASSVGSNEWITSAIEISRSPGRDPCTKELRFPTCWCYVSPIRNNYHWKRMRNNTQRRVSLRRKGMRADLDETIGF